MLSSTIFGSPLIPGVTFPCTTSALWIASVPAWLILALFIFHHFPMFPICQTFWLWGTISKMQSSERTHPHCCCVVAAREMPCLQERRWMERQNQRVRKKCPWQLQMGQSSVKLVLELRVKSVWPLNTGMIHELEKWLAAGFSLPQLQKVPDRPQVCRSRTAPNHATGRVGCRLGEDWHWQEIVGR